MHARQVECIPLGQAGFRLQAGETMLLIDPYLSNSVEEQEGPHQRRLVEIWRQPSSIDDADIVLITHAHLDHCDRATLVPLAKASPSCRFIGPNEVCKLLATYGITADRLIVAPTEWLDLGGGLRIHATPAAHPTIDMDATGRWRCVGYVLEFNGRRIYHSGDTFVVQDLIEFVLSLRPIDVAMLPVNEHNYFRETLGIVGNMGLRDAFQLATVLGVETLVPMHWDMFKANSVFREEIELYHRLSAPSFSLRINPDVL